jgi:predicted nucleic acid-binding protein
VTTPPETIILDNEAVVALLDVTHPKHRSVLPFLEGTAQRRSRNPARRVLVPVAVRVEAGWDRHSAGAAVINRVSGATDVPLDADSADGAQRLRQAAGVSVVDAAVAEVARTARPPVVILTSDVDDMTRLARAIGGDIRVVRV